MAAGVAGAVGGAAAQAALQNALNAARGTIVATVGAALANSLVAETQQAGVGDGAYTPVNPNYIVQMTMLGTNLSIKATAPAMLDFEIQNDYIDLLSYASELLGQGRITNQVLTGSHGANSTFGQSRAAMVQVWMGTRPLDLQLPLQFRAYSDPQKEVINPVRNLIAMCSPPSASGAYLAPPGPSLKDALVGGASAALAGTNFFQTLNKSIVLRVGQNFVMYGLIIPHLRVHWGTRSTVTGLPTSADVDVGLRTFTSYSRDNILQSFFGSGGTSAPLIGAG